MDFFDEAELRLKEQLRKRESKEVAAMLGMSGPAWSGRRKRGTFPEKELRALAQQRPDLNLDVDYVLTGVAQRADLQGVKQAALASATRVSGRNLARPNVDAALGRKAEAPQGGAATAADEQCLLAAFRSADEAGRTALLLVAQALVKRGG